ncbi:MAG: bifunctional metallophosphatase/5'-nucleotidase [Proteobacteria bacterium]|nr:bifunctional metallophosphatase/5'-nucleotidase [Pseudomonadota bacterium]MBI3496842.1 bifunctional metallophosphatase/5'-nucleotidase [Pseudomonadota bacterium]
MWEFLRRSRLLAAVLALALVAGTAWGQTAKITFLHTNDVYEIAPARGWGGFAPLMTLLKQERAQAQNAVTTFGGDLISPSLMSGLTKGQQMVELMNAVGLDLAIFGNHEFDFGDDVLKQRMAESKFPWLATNVLGPDKKPFGTALSTVMKEVGGFKLGFFGLTTPETVTLSSPGKEIIFAPMIESAGEAVKALKDQGAEIVVAITHLTIAEDRELVRRVKGIDLVLGGHDHDPITFYEGSTLIHKAGFDAHFLAAVDLTVTRAAQQSGPPRITVVPAWRMHAVYNVAPDPDIAALVKRHTDKLDTELGVKIGTSATPLDSRTTVVRAEEAAIGNLIADAMRAALGAEVALANGGGIRGNRTYDPGYQLTRRDVFTELPFGNTTVLLELKGSDLLAALEHSVGRVEEKQGRFLQVSGLSFAYDPKKAAGSRVLEVKVGGQPLDPGRVYKVATIDYIAGGGDGFEVLKKGKSLIDPSAAKLTANQVMDYIAAKGTVSPALEGRITTR